MKNFIAEGGIKKLVQLVLTELDGKEDIMEEITAEEVQAMWNPSEEST